MWHLPTPVFVISTYTFQKFFFIFSIVVSLSLVSYDDDCIRMGEKENNKTLPEYFFSNPRESQNSSSAFVFTFYCC